MARALRVSRMPRQIPAGQRHLPAVRQQMSEPALRAFFNIASAWGLKVEEQQALLGWPASSTFYKYKSGQAGSLSYDMLMRISLILGIYKALHILYPDAALADRWGAMATVIMAPFCHPHPAGGRFNGPDRGAWYGSLSLETAHAEVIYHRTAELAEIGVFDTYVQERAYLADFRSRFHDIRARNPAYRKYYSASSYAESQKLGRELLNAGSNGIIYRSVRQTGGYCLACFRPKLVTNVRQGHHYEYRWTGSAVPAIRQLRGRG